MGTRQLVYYYPQAVRTVQDLLVVFAALPLSYHSLLAAILRDAREWKHSVVEAGFSVSARCCYSVWVRVCPMQRIWNARARIW